jgi:hypothetical protein
LNSASFAAASGAALNLSTHMADASSPRAVSPAAFAMVCEVPPVTQPPQLKPTTIVAITAAMHAQTSMVFEGW